MTKGKLHTPRQYFNSAVDHTIRDFIATSKEKTRRFQAKMLAKLSQVGVVTPQSDVSSSNMKQKQLFQLEIVEKSIHRVEYVVGIEPLKEIHDVTKLDLTILLLSFWCIDIYFSIQSMSLTLYITCVHQELHKGYKSWVPCKQISFPQLVHGFRQSSRNYSSPPLNLKDDLSWPSRWVSHGECTSICDAHQIRSMMNHDTKLLIVMIHQVTILHGLSILRGY